MLKKYVRLRHQQFPPQTRQYEALVTSYYNDCYANFAVAQRDKELCLKISENGYLTKKCVEDIKSLTPELKIDVSEFQ